VGATPRGKEVNLYLAREGYEIAPISVWFYDPQFAQAYIRALAAGDETAKEWLRTKFVDTAIDQLRVQAAAARTIFRRDPVHIWLIHGTAIAADCLTACSTSIPVWGSSSFHLRRRCRIR
jgi:hypothetical protein